MNRKEEYQDERWAERAAEIRALDNHRCAMCGAKDIKLHVHHLAYPPPPFHIWDATNAELVTLCEDCHTKVHESEERPKFDSSTRFISLAPKFQRGNCGDCKCMQQPFLCKDAAEKFAHELCLYKIECNHIEVNKCGKCCFLDICKRRNPNIEPLTYACEYFHERWCNDCVHFHPSKNDGDEFNYCDVINGKTYWGDDGRRCNYESFECKFKSIGERKRHYEKILR